MDKNLIRVEQIAKMTGLSRGTIHNYYGQVRDNFPCAATNIGRVLFWRKDKIERWAARRAHKRRERSK